MEQRVEIVKRYWFQLTLAEQNRKKMDDHRFRY